MAEMREIIQDVPEKAGKLFRNKTFLIVAGGVAVLALWLSRDKEDAQVTPTGYAGYPEVGGGVGDGGGWLDAPGAADQAYLDEIDRMAGDFNDQLTAQDDYYQAALAQQDLDYRAAMDSQQVEMQSAVESLNNQLLTMDASYQQTLLEMQKSADIGQMLANSSLWYGADDDTRKKLHEENDSIAARYGFTYDDYSGQWLDSGVPIYTRTDLIGQTGGKTTTIPATASTTATTGWSGTANSRTVVTTDKYVQVQSDGNAPKGTKVGDIVRTAGGDYKVVDPGTSGATYNASSGLWSVKVSGSSGGSSGGGSSSKSGGGSSSKSGGGSSGKTNYVQVQSDGNAPKGTKVGDVVKTAGGDYKVVKAGTAGASYNSKSGLWSVKV